MESSQASTEATPDPVLPALGNPGRGREAGSLLTGDGTTTRYLPYDDTRQRSDDRLIELQQDAPQAKPGPLSGIQAGSRIIFTGPSWGSSVPCRLDTPFGRRILLVSSDFLS